MFSIRVLCEVERQVIMNLFAGFECVPICNLVVSFLFFFLFSNQTKKEEGQKKKVQNKKNTYWSHLPKRGTASDVTGIVSATIFKKTVNERRTVIPKQ